MTKKNKKQTTKSVSEVIQEEKITWEDINAMSDSDDDDDSDDIAIESNVKAKNLRQAIKDGKFDALLSNTNTKKDDDDDDDEEFEEDVLEFSDGNSEGNDEDDEKLEEEIDDEEDSNSSDNGDEDQEADPGNPEKVVDANDEDQQSSDSDNDDDKQEKMIEDEEDEDDNHDESDEDETEEKYKQLEANNKTNSKALGVVTAELVATHAKFPWAETFVIVPSTPLPFGEHGDPDSNPLDIHDDLKREVAFYNTALEAVNEARQKCKQVNIPFSRPDDFFAEMVKTDDHMAKVKDRLIFENKKIEAVAQRKGNKEQKLRAKESHANRIAEKAKRKREHFQQVEEWANSAAKYRGNALRDDMDEQFLNGRNRNNNGPNKKRQAVDRKFGFGGKRGRFKQNDRQSLNDTSGFNPRGNFAGGMKRTAKTKSGSGAARPGKRARDTKRARR